MTDREELQERLDSLESRLDTTGDDDGESWLEHLETEAHEVYNRHNASEKIDQLEQLRDIVLKNGLCADGPTGKFDDELTYAGTFYVDLLMDSAAYDLEQRGL